jgi:hypothetical protein
MDWRGWFNVQDTSWKVQVRSVPERDENECRIDVETSGHLHLNAARSQALYKNKN